MHSQHMAVLPFDVWTCVVAQCADANTLLAMRAVCKQFKTIVAMMPAHHHAWAQWNPQWPVNHTSVARVLGFNPNDKSSVRPPPTTLTLRGVAQTTNRPLSGDPVTLNVIILCRWASHLTHLSLATLLVDDASLSEAIVTCPSLTALTLHDVRFNSGLLHPTGVNHAITKCINMTSLALTGSTCHEHRLMRLLPMMSSLAHLTVLDISGGMVMTDEIIEGIVQHLPKLTAINLSHCDAGEESSLEFGHFIMLLRMPNLRNLLVNNVCFGNDNFGPFPAIYTHDYIVRMKTNFAMSMVEVLGARGIGDGMTLTMATLLVHNLPHLRKLDISYNESVSPAVLKTCFNVPLTHLSLAQDSDISWRWPDGRNIDDIYIPNHCKDLAVCGLHGILLHSQIAPHPLECLDVTDCPDVRSEALVRLIALAPNFCSLMSPMCGNNTYTEQNLLLATVAARPMVTLGFDCCRILDFAPLHGLCQLTRLQLGSVSPIAAKTVPALLAAVGTRLRWLSVECEEVPCAAIVHATAAHCAEARSVTVIVANAPPLPLPPLPVQLTCENTNETKTFTAEMFIAEFGAAPDRHNFGPGDAIIYGASGLWHTFACLPTTLGKTISAAAVTAIFKKCTHLKNLELDHVAGVDAAALPPFLERLVLRGAFTPTNAWPAVRNLTGTSKIGSTTINW